MIQVPSFPDPSSVWAHKHLVSNITQPCDLPKNVIFIDASSISRVMIAAENWSCSNLICEISEISWHLEFSNWINSVNENEIKMISLRTRNSPSPGQGRSLRSRIELFEYLFCCWSTDIQAENAVQVLKVNSDIVYICLQIQVVSVLPDFLSDFLRRNGLSPHLLAPSVYCPLLMDPLPREANVYLCYPTPGDESGPQSLGNGNDRQRSTGETVSLLLNFVGQRLRCI